MSPDTPPTGRPSASGAARDPRPALIAAAVVAGVMFLQSLLWAVPTGFGQADVFGAMRYLGVELLGTVIPFAAGVFLVLWLLPVRSGDRVIVVLGKGLLGAVAGAILVVVVGFAVALASAGLWAFRDFGHLAYSPLPGFASVALGRAPLVMLVVLVQWVLVRPPRA